MKNKLIIILLIVFLFLPVSNNLFSNNLIKRNYYGLLVYSRNKTPGAKMAVHLMRKSLSGAFKGFYSSYIYNAYKIASYFPGNKINKKNFGNMEKNYPLMNYFVTARIYYRYKKINKRARFRIRISIYKTGKKVKRIKRFFINSLIKNYNNLSTAICNKISKVTKIPWVSLKFNFMENDAGIAYSKARYYFENKNYSKANKEYDIALSNLNRIDPETISHYVKSLIKTDSKIKGLKNPGANSNHKELAAAYFYYFNKNYNKSLKYVLSYLSKNENSELKIHKTIKSGKCVFGKNYFAVYSDKKLITGKLNSSEKLNKFTLKSSIKEIYFNNDKLIINGIAYNPVSMEKSVLPDVIIDHKPLKVTYVKENGKSYLIHLMKKSKKTTRYECDELNVTKVSSKEPLFAVSSGKRVFVFGMRSGRLIWKDKLNFHVKNIFLYKNKVAFFNTNSVEYRYMATGRVFYKKTFKKAKRIIVEGNNFVSIYNDSFIYNHIKYRKKFKKRFPNFKIIDVRIHPGCLNVIISDKESISYRYTILKNSKIVYRKIYSGKLIGARYKHGVFLYDGYLMYKLSRLNRILNSHVNLLTARIYSKVNSLKESLRYAFISVRENPENFESLDFLNSKIRGLKTLKKKLILYNVFMSTHGFKFSNMPVLKHINKFIISYLFYPFYKNGYKRLLETLGYKTPEKVFSLSLGKINNFKIIGEKILLNLGNGNTVLLDSKSEQKVWSMQGFRFINTVSSADNSLLLYSDSDSLLISVDTSTGRPIWSKNLRRLFKSTPNFYFFNKLIILSGKKKALLL